MMKMMAALNARKAVIAAQKVKDALTEKSTGMANEHFEKCMKITTNAAGVENKKINSNQTRDVIAELCLRIVELENRPVEVTPSEKAVGGKKSKPRGAAVVFENKVKPHVDGECCNVLNQFKGGKSKFWKCDEDAVVDGVCGACQKKNIADGYFRYGQVVEGEDFKITASIFGTVAQIGGVAASHKAYVVKLKNQLGDEER